MCGILALYLADPEANVNQLIFDGMTALQHRGQDAAGMVTCKNGRLYLRKDSGLVKDVFQLEHMLNLVGNMGLGHLRYPTAGSTSGSEAQPFYTNSPYGISLAHNGNLTNAAAIRKELRTSRRHINTDSDTELLMNVFADGIVESATGDCITPADVWHAVTHVHARCRGAYAVVALLPGQGIVGFRDPCGIRPLVIGTREHAHGVTDFALASESVAIDLVGLTLLRDVAPGEAIFFDIEGRMHALQCAPSPVLSPCVFEFVYFARPDSIIDGVPVHESRRVMGDKLAAQILRRYPEHGIDVVMPIPDTSRTSALQLSYALGVPYREGFIKNRYIARTFIMPGQETRKKTVRLKLNTVKGEFAGRAVLLVDDSVVRGTTSMQLVQMARDAGARKVYFCSAAPAIRHPNVYGIDMPTRSELVAAGRTEEQVAAHIGADWMVYQELEDLEAAVREVNPSLGSFDSSCFNGQYVTGDVDESYLSHVAEQRNDGAMHGGMAGAKQPGSDYDSDSGGASPFNAPVRTKRRVPSIPQLGDAVTAAQQQAAAQHGAAAAPPPPPAVVAAGMESVGLFNAPKSPSSSRKARSDGGGVTGL